MGNNSERTPPIVIRRKKRVRPHHGGAWKIAYADFVTALMAFFLLMWLLGSATKGELMGIAEYFQTPLRVALFGGQASGDSSTLAPGGGQDPSLSSGQARRGDAGEQKKKVNLRASRSELDLPSRTFPPEAQSHPGAPLRSQAGGTLDRMAAEAAEGQALAKLKSRIDGMIDANPKLFGFKNQLLLDVTEEGLRIQIMDDKNRPMFDLSSSALQPYAAEILDEIGSALNEVPNKITVTGHTDATPFRARAGMTNWELSAERANVARRQMERAGMNPEKVLRVIGSGASLPLRPTDPLDPINRRISVVVLKRSAEESLAALSRSTPPVTSPVATPAVRPSSSPGR